MAQDDVVLQSGLWKAAREEIDAQTVKIKELQERLAVVSAELSQLSAIHGKLTDDLSRVKSQRAADATVSYDQKSIAGVHERLIRRAKMTRKWEESSTTLLIATFLVLLVQWDVHKNRCEVLAMKNKCMYTWASR